uniref:Uncharacterized protein n=1 Tax=Arundo donax TaxID=35708 RepID=A0A0A9B672_ARUDO
MIARKEGYNLCIYIKRPKALYSRHLFTGKQWKRELITSTCLCAYPAWRKIYIYL